MTIIFEFYFKKIFLNFVGMINLGEIILNYKDCIITILWDLFINIQLSIKWFKCFNGLLLQHRKFYLLIIELNSK